MGEILSRCQKAVRSNDRLDYLRQVARLAIRVRLQRAFVTGYGYVVLERMSGQSRRYMRLESVAPVSDDPSSGRPA